MYSLQRQAKGLFEEAHLWPLYTSSMLKKTDRERQTFLQAWRIEIFARVWLLGEAREAKQGCGKNSWGGVIWRVRKIREAPKGVAIEEHQYSNLDSIFGDNSKKDKEREGDKYKQKFFRGQSVV